MKASIQTLSALLIFITLQTFGAKVPIGTARVVAKNLFAERTAAAGKSYLSNAAISGEFILDKNAEPLVYIFNFDTEKGFVIVSAEDHERPVLAYSFTGSYGKESFPPAFLWMLEQYKNEISLIRTKKLSQSTSIQAEWSNYSMTSGFKPAKSIQAVSPLTTTTWDQGCHYNDSCPVDQNGPCNRVVTGCVATCMAQILKYHNYPAHGSGSHAYTHPVYGSLHAHFGSNTYNWTSMPNNLTNGNSAVAQLMYHCGVAVDMNYSAGGSGAPSVNAAMAFIHFFNYSSGLQLLQKSDFTTTAWNNLITTELNASRPMYYAGYNPSEGHAFVLDGFQGTDYFHFNWGWSGAYNGYFYLTSLDPAGITFNNNQEMIIGITPGINAACAGSTTLTTMDGDFSDGSYGNSYTNNANCQWLIQPTAGIAYINLEFMTFATEATNDVVRVYDGPSTSAPLIGAFSGNAIPPVINSSGNSLLLTFTSNSTTTAAGWSVHYESKYCYPHDTLTAYSGTFDDGSGTSNYADKTDCYWLIKPPSNVHILLQLSNIHTEKDFDFVKVYDGQDTLAPLLGSFSGDTTALPIISTGNKMLLHFTSDEGLSAAGWQAAYSTSVGVPQFSRESLLMVYPNPAHDQSTLIIKNQYTGIIEVRICDLAGKLIKAQSFLKNYDHFSKSLNLNGLTQGYYLLSAQMGAEKLVRPLVIR